MAKRLIFILMLACNISGYSAQAQSCKLPCAFEKYKEKDAQLFYLSIFITYGNKYNDIFEYGYMDSGTHDIIIPDSKKFYCYLLHKYNAFDRYQKEQFTRTIKNWFNNSDFINLIADKNNVPAEKIIYYPASTRKLFDKYTTYKGRDWSSLSSTESHDLFTDLMNYLNLLPNEKMNLIKNQLARTAKKFAGTS